MRTVIFKYIARRYLFTRGACGYQHWLWLSKRMASNNERGEAKSQKGYLLKQKKRIQKKVLYITDTVHGDTVHGHH